MSKSVFYTLFSVKECLIHPTQYTDFFIYRPRTLNCFRGPGATSRTLNPIVASPIERTNQKRSFCTLLFVLCTCGRSRGANTDLGGATLRSYLGRLLCFFIVRVVKRPRGAPGPRKQLSVRLSLEKNKAKSDGKKHEENKVKSDGKFLLSKNN